MASHLNQPHFQDETKARKYLETQRWPNGPICPHCGSISKDHYAIESHSKKGARPGLYKCKDCREQFTATVGTIFERSKIKLNVWLQAVFLLCSSKKGMSSHQMHRMLGVTYKTAWFITHRIREAMRSDGGLLGSGGGIVEADETFIGRRPDKTKRRGAGHKNAVFSLVQRDGKVRSFHVARVNSKNLKPILLAQVAKDAHVFTDAAGYHKKSKLGNEFASHETVNHLLGEYARGHVHTNTVEGYFSILKRGLIGTYHHVGSQHLQRYVTEFDFRASNREVTDKERTDNALKSVGGKRLTYRRTAGQQTAG